MSTTVCKDCKYRTFNCHAICKDYEKFKENLEKVRKNKQKYYYERYIMIESARRHIIKK